MHRSDSGAVTPLQFLSSVAAFLGLSALGGVLLAAIVVPVTTVAGTTVQGSVGLLDYLPTEFQNADLPEQSVILDRNGELIATFYHQNRVVVPLEDISPWLWKAVVATEDKRFWDHQGVDGEGLMRAVVVNLTTSDSPGASTLTQQLIKNTLIQNAEAADDNVAKAEATEVSLARKLREANMALALEERRNEQFGSVCSDSPEVDCGKKSILEQYLNIAQFGSSVYGAEAASQLYFSKPAKELTAIEAATIAGITQNPYKWDPKRFPENTVVRRNTVLLVMYQQGMFSEAEYREYIATPLEDTLHWNDPKYSCVASDEAPFFCDYVTKIISKDPIFRGEGSDLLYRGGLTITTTLDLKLQKIANQELRKKVPEKDKSNLANALVSIKVGTGEIVAMAQNRTFDPGADGSERGKTSINYATDREDGGSRGFSPGSTFKPIILATWLNDGHYLNETVSGDVREWDPGSWQASCLGPAPFAGAPAWKPSNASGGGTSQQTALTATQSSINTSYAAMTNRLDLCNIAEMAERLGFERADGLDFEIIPSVVLGTQNASPLTMAEVASVFASGGIHCEPIAILSITDKDGGVVRFSNGDEVVVPPADCKRVIDKKVADGVAYAMTFVIKSGSGTAAQLKGGRPAAGKTGTAQNNVHTWFMGFTPQLATVTWLGNPNADVPQRNIRINGKTYSRVYGGTISAPTWKAFMDRALSGKPKAKLPTSIPAGLGGWKIEVPDVVGQSSQDARHLINDAGMRYAVDDVRYYDENLEPGTVVAQSREAGGSAGPGETLYIQLSTAKLPSWWTVWPASKKECKAPKDWWGSSWPPAEFSTTPPAGWVYDPGECAPDPDPTPTPAPTP